MKNPVFPAGRLGYSIVGCKTATTGTTRFRDLRMKRKESTVGFVDDAKNKAEDLKGRGKEAAGSATGDDQLRHEGQTDQGKASVKDKVTTAADKLKDGVNSAKDKLTGR
jgi:uncharacterized protein YjbJ (UPF0337 family)